MLRLRLGSLQGPSRILQQSLPLVGGLQMRLRLGSLRRFYKILRWQQTPALLNRLLQWLRQRPSLQLPEKPRQGWGL